MVGHEDTNDNTKMFKATITHCQFQTRLKPSGNQSMKTLLPTLALLIFPCGKLSDDYVEP
jgi:hypothetical protein